MSKGGAERDVHWTPPKQKSSASFRGTSDFHSGRTSSDQAKADLGLKTAPDDDALAKNRRIAFVAEASIETNLDTTGSNKELALIAYDKAPSFWGQIKYPGKTLPEIEEIEAGKLKAEVHPYLREYLISICYFGDADFDRYSQQVSDPCATANDLIRWQKKMFREGNGGGDKMESSELRAFFSLERVDISKVSWPCWILTTDEAPKPMVYKRHVKKELGFEIEADIPTAEVFKQLFAKYKGNVFINLNPYFGRYSNGAIKNPDVTERIYERWLGYIEPKYHHHIIMIEEEKSIIDLQLGIIALATGARDKYGYTQDMIGKEQTQERVANVWKSLDPYWAVLSGEQPVATPGSSSRTRSGARRT